MLLWDSLNPHVSAAMRELVATRVWLHVIWLPAYAPDLNPTEGMWVAPQTRHRQPRRPRRHQLLTITRDRLKRIQYEPPVKMLSVPSVPEDGPGPAGRV